MKSYAIVGKSSLGGYYGGRINRSDRLDFLANRPMEIDAIFSNPLRAAQEAGYAAPIIEVLQRQLRFLDRNAKL